MGPIAKRNKLVQKLYAMQNDRLEMSKGSYCLATDAAIALKMITQITNAFRNDKITFGDMQNLLYTYIVEGK